MKRVVSGVEREPVAIDSGHTVANTTGSHRRSYTLHQPPPQPPPPPSHHTYYIAVLRTALSQL